MSPLESRQSTSHLVIFYTLTLLSQSNSKINTSTSSPDLGSCYHYGCGSYSSSQFCACNTACISHGDCCSDYDSLCQRGHFEECSVAPLIPGDRRRNKESLRVVSWNVQWLFLNYSHSMGGFVCPGTGCDWKNTPDAIQHAQAVASYLDAIDGDIIVVPEVADCWTLRQFIDMMTVNAAEYKPYLLKGTDTATGQNVGLISKIDPIDDLFRSNQYVNYPVADSVCPDLSSSGSTGCSKHFGARFQVNGLPSNLSLFGVHFLAIPTDSLRCLRREGQATIIGQMVSEEVNNGNVVIVAGDLNDYAESVCDIGCNRPISSVESILRNAGDLVNAAERIRNTEERYTSWWNCDNDCLVKEECLSMIDQVLVSRNGLFDAVDSVHVDHGFESGCDSIYSDHWPFIVDFDLNKISGFKSFDAAKRSTMDSMESDDEEMDDMDSAHVMWWKVMDPQSRWTVVSVFIAIIIVSCGLCYGFGFKMGMGKRRRLRGHGILRAESGRQRVDETVGGQHEEMQTELIQN